MTIRLYFNIPNQSKISDFGSNPFIFHMLKKRLLKNLKKIETLTMGLYLFNNPHLYQVLKQIKGDVKIITTPPGSYKGKKIQLMRKIYFDYMKKLKPKKPNFEILFYPFMCKWTKTPYTIDGISYSFHLKSGYIQYKDGTYDLLFTSSNLSPPDPPSSELLVIIESDGKSKFDQPTLEFFRELESRSVPLVTYFKYNPFLKSQFTRIFDFLFQGSKNMKQGTYNKTPIVFTSPFLKMSNWGSSWVARKMITNAIETAEKEILLCSQHFHDINPLDQYPYDSIVDSLIKKKNENDKIEIKVLKRVQSSILDSKWRSALTENLLKYFNISQKFNKLIHEKFIIIDRRLIIISSGSFTPSEFCWCPKNMIHIIDYNDKLNQILENARELFKCDGKIYIQKDSKKVRIQRNDVFCDINFFIMINSEKLSHQLSKHFENLFYSQHSKPLVSS